MINQVESDGVVAPDEGEGELSGEVRVVNSDDLGDFCIIDASMTEAESQISIHPYVHRIRPILGLIHTL
jgi:hypothetical protein